MDYMNAKQAGERWGISDRRVSVLCREGRINGAVNMGRMWLIPKETEKPADERIKSGKFIGTRKDRKPKEK